jgi:hypothetical protein
VIPDDTRLRELYYAVDERSVSLLQTKAEMVRNIELNERNRQSRDYDKIMKTKKLHDICGDLGHVLADLMVLVNNWKALLKSIGGYQYVKDLVGRQRAYFEHIKKTSLALMKRRRGLLEAFEEDLQQQYARVTQIAFDLGLKASNAYWDSPTSVEVEAEADENRECCRREADFELRLRRQTEHVQIPPAPFHPVLLLLDTKIPRKLKTYLTTQLKTFDFLVCTRPQTDEKLVLEMQAIIDQQRHVILFANRGSHSLARLTFLSSFNSVISALIPVPRIVALDCTLSLRVEDWSDMFCIEQAGMTDFNVGESAYCDLALGKLRKMAGLFRECLTHTTHDDSGSDTNSGNSDDDSDDDDSDDDDGDAGDADVVELRNRRNSASANARRNSQISAAAMEAAATAVSGGGGGGTGGPLFGPDGVVNIPKINTNPSIAGAGGGAAAVGRKGSVSISVSAAHSPSGGGGGGGQQTPKSARSPKAGAATPASPAGGSVSSKNLHVPASARRGSQASNPFIPDPSLYGKAKRFDYRVVPSHVRKAFMIDFHDFVTHIAQKLPVVNPDSVCVMQVKVNPPRTNFDFPVAPFAVAPPPPPPVASTPKADAKPTITYNFTSTPTSAAAGATGGNKGKGGGGIPPPPAFPGVSPLTGTSTVRKSMLGASPPGTSSARKSMMQKQPSMTGASIASSSAAAPSTTTAAAASAAATVGSGSLLFAGERGPSSNFHRLGSTRADSNATSYFQQIQAQQAERIRKEQADYAKRSNPFLYSDMVLAATLSTILNFWQAPLSPWSGRDIARGSNAFRKRCLSLSYEELCDILEMRQFADSGVVVCKRLDVAMQLTEAWHILEGHDFYVHPARNLLARWTIEIVRLMNL